VVLIMGGWMLDEAIAFGNQAFQSIGTEGPQ